MSLDEQLLAAHEACDTDRLILLYTQAAAAADTPDAAGFYLTHAYVFALEAGAPNAAALRDKLIEMKREDPV